jgi:desampylase
MILEVTSGVLAQLHAEALRAAPEECCGLLLGRAGRIEEVRRARNVATNRHIRFEIDPVALLAAHKAERAGGPRLIGYYHSHPNGACMPSATDREHSTGDSRIWAIIAQSEVAFWQDRPNGFGALPFRVVEQQVFEKK